jgi:hypothetical protein
LSALKNCGVREYSYSETCSSDHVWAKKKWSLNEGGLLIEVEMYGIATVGTGPSGLRMQVVTRAVLTIPAPGSNVAQAIHNVHTWRTE